MKSDATPRSDTVASDEIVYDAIVYDAIVYDAIVHDEATRPPALHYVGFRGDEYTAAIRVFGPPDFIHIGWDRWARLDVAPGDTVIFARGCFDDTPSIHSYPDLHEGSITAP